MRSVAIALPLLLVVGPAWADPHTNDARNRASFQVESFREIANDWVTARLAVSAEGKDPAAVAAEVNEKMAAATARAKKHDHVELRSGSYVTHPVYENNRIVRWRARQELRLESGEIDKLSKLIGRLQADSVLLNGIDFSVRRETRKALEDELILEALAKFRRRADLVTRGMGEKSWSLIDVSVGASGGAPHRVMMQMDESRSMARAQAAPPSFESGTSDLRVHVSGVIELD